MRASGYKRAVSDWYVEPSSIVASLASVETFEGCVWDPCCGAGNIPRTLEAKGISTVGSDIADRGAGYAVADFFASSQAADNIVSNPPYGVIEQFIEHALTLAHRKVAVLARLALLEGQKRRHLFARTPLARVWVSSKRISMPPGGTDIKARGGTIAYAWFVWEHGFSGRPALGWLP